MALFPFVFVARLPFELRLLFALGLLLLPLALRVRLALEVAPLPFELRALFVVAVALLLFELPLRLALEPRLGAVFGRALV